MNKKLIICIFAMASFGSFAKNTNTVPLMDYTSIKNYKWEDARKIPYIDKKLYNNIKKSDIDETVIIKYVDAPNTGNGFVNVDKDIVIANGLYTYNTKLNNTVLENGLDANRIIFTQNATVSNNATITLRTNISRNISDSVSFENLRANHININVINTASQNDMPRYKSLFLMSVPAASNVTVSLGGNPSVRGVAYGITRKAVNDKIYYFLTPQFANYTQKESVMEYENENGFTDNSVSASDKKLRELVRIMTMDRSIGTSSVIDVD